MIQRVLFVVAVLACVLSLLGCASTAAPQPGQATAAAPVARKGALPLPPQPTSPPSAPGAPYAWQTAVPALIVSGPTLVPKPPTAAPTSPAATKAATAQPTKGAAAAVPTAPGVATGKRSEAKFTYDPALSTIEDADPLDQAVKKTPGIFDSVSSQTSVTVAYDAGLITVEQIQVVFAQLGHPIKPQ